jgi:hypothetical protein
MEELTTSKHVNCEILLKCIFTGDRIEPAARWCRTGARIVDVADDHVYFKFPDSGSLWVVPRNLVMLMG